MRSFDLTPLLRSSVGFDRMQRALEAAARLDTAANAYPPYDIEVSGEDAYRISLAVAGFSRDDIEITVKENSLEITAQAKTEEAAEREFLHRGIARRAFEKRFELADHVKVVGASMDNGLLHVDLVREIPQSLKPRKIEITADNPKALVHKDAA
ncbi:MULTISPECIES: Hsp20 family protein [Terasakiella]|uniref:Heat-shock protein Hsp20 n=1 Tax=Terasakiella brassicae TaxID=1634917 RepID=A0A917BSL8_9PROT|nr:Hsp20 family protein [Terasakiella brassicae]GGF54452.1 heat-shock protein Hsp20 [Terasakiella brassicae]